MLLAFANTLIAAARQMIDHPYNTRSDTSGER
jgi:hypothetical protein